MTPVEQLAHANDLVAAWRRRAGAAEPQARAIERFLAGMRIIVTRGERG